MSDLQLNSVRSSTAFLPRTDSAQNLTATTIGGSAKKQALMLGETHTADVHNFYRTERSRTLEELQEHPVFGQLWQAPKPEAPSPLETTRNHRLAILAREFEGAELTREDEARLAILTQRLRRLAPKVTAKSWTIAEEALTQLETVSARIDDISARYGL